MIKLQHERKVSSASARWLTAGVLALLFAFGLEWIVGSSIAFAADAADAAGHGPVDTAHTFKNSKAVAFLFWFFSLATLGGAVFVITRRNMVSAVMGMVATFFAIAGLYLMLYASFLAVIQVLVYAGAIMVLFVFVIMILNRPEAEPWAVQGLLGKSLAGLGLLYLFKRLASVLWQVKDTHNLEVAKDQINVEVALNQADPAVASGAAELITKTYEFGTVEGVGYTLFTKYLFPFEAVSIVLLVAVVGAIAIARPTKPEGAKPEGATGDSGTAESGGAES
jgi:NADH-quinone oxidoreductase subunit J